MKKKELEIFLQKIPDFEKPKPGLEQYITPAAIVADIIFIAFQMGDIENKIVLDLGCGTGIFSVGACVLGAKKVTGIDLEEDAIKTAKKFADENNLKIDFIIKDVKDVNIFCDTVIMNPPFGAQKSNINADRRFIEKAFEKSKVIYTLHLTKTIAFIEKMVSSLKGNIDFTKEYSFPIKHSQSFHAKKVVFFDITLLRILTKGN
jgi:putative methylase